MGNADALRGMVLDAVKRVRDNTVVGLGSGSTVSVFVEALAERIRAGSLHIRVIPTSLQIKLKAEALGFELADETLIPSTDMVFDGADQIDSRFNMIKGGGGALLREKVLMHASKEAIILADESKYVDALSRSVPVEVLPYARTYVAGRLRSMGGEPTVRSLEKGYPFLTENGNLILDTSFGRISEPSKLEYELKSIAGVMEVGIFSKHANVYYKARRDGNVEVLTP